MISVEKPGSPSELVHHGVKGQKWGVRKEEDSSGEPLKGESAAEKSARHRATAKKVAIGVGILTAVAGAAFVAYKLNQSGSLSMSSLKKAAKIAPKQKTAAVEKLIQEQKDVIHLTRGKHQGQEFLKKGGTPNFFTHWENAFVKELGNANASDAFIKLSNGSVAAAFHDPEGLKDFSGRPISHQVIVPKSMSAGLNSAEDVKNKVWEHIKAAYLEKYPKTKIGFDGKPRI